MSNNYFNVAGPFTFSPGLIHAFSTKIIASGVGDVEVLRFTPSVDGAYLLDIEGFAYTDLASVTDDHDRIKEFRSRLYVVRRSGVLSIVPCMDEIVHTDTGNFTSSISGSDYLLQIGRNATLSRQITAIVHVHMAPNSTDTSVILLSDAT